MTPRQSYAIGRTTPTGWDHAVPVTPDLKGWDITDAKCGAQVKVYASGQGPIPWSATKTACGKCCNQLGVQAP